MKRKHLKPIASRRDTNFPEWPMTFRMSRVVSEAYDIEVLSWCLQAAGWKIREAVDCLSLSFSRRSDCSRQRHMFSFIDVPLFFSFSLACLCIYFLLHVYVMVFCYCLSFVFFLMVCYFVIYVLVDMMYVFVFFLSPCFGMSMFFYTYIEWTAGWLSYFESLFCKAQLAVSHNKQTSKQFYDEPAGRNKPR